MRRPDQTIPPPPAIAVAGDGWGMPAPLSARRRWWTQAVTVLALGLTGGYLAWRIVETLPAAGWSRVLGIALLVAEVHAFGALALFAYNLWHVGEEADVPPDRLPDGKVALLIPTYNEPVEVLLPVVTAAVGLEPAHETWVLDDGNRPEVAALADRLGARYLARTDNTHAKAGNLNNALDYIDADFVGVLDADHVPMPGFLTELLPYLNDPEVAVVQSPQAFYNTGTFEYFPASGAEQRYGPVSEQTLFYRVIQPSKARRGAAFWCGTTAVVRVAALRQIGGVQVGSVTEDLDTTIELHKHGWRSTFHNSVVAVGLAAPDIKTYLSQRNRWATGAMQIWRRRGPLLGPGLTWAQRWSYLATLTAWFDGWRTLLLTLLPLAVLATGASPIVADAAWFFALFGISFAAQQAALWLLSAGSATPLRSIEFDLLRLPATSRATLALLSPDPSRPFEVTRKGGTDVDELRPPALLVALLGLHVLALAWVAAGALGLVALHYTSLAVVVVSTFWACFNGTLVVRALRRATDPRHRPDRRSAVRFASPWAVRVGDARIGRLLDLSIGGARLQLSGAAPLPDHIEVELFEGDRVVAVPAQVLRQQVTEDGRVEANLALEQRHQVIVSSLLFQPQPVADVMPVRTLVDEEPARSREPAVLSPV